ncbi:transporter [Lithospermum erythrorhizon]|uniref:Transporter n=1 Tax=Lithospermum erythrorhizon TaxID=34254 RepID=A0AAV3Q404_LITER
MTFNITSVKTSSAGAWQGDNPLQYAFPLLIIQTTLVLLISRVLVRLFKPLRQPKVIAEIVGGLMLGPSALGRNKEFMNWIFPSWSTPILESVASIGLLFFLFLVGLELDLNSIRSSGKKAFGIAAAGISLPFILGVGLTFLLRKVIKEASSVGYSQQLMFIGVSLSITAFPVLARILAELKLLTTNIGQTAMAAAAFNDVAAWILLALAVAISGGTHSSPLVSIWILLSGVTFVIFMFLVVKPVMQWVAKQSSSASGNELKDEGYVCLTLAAVMVSGFLTDLIGIHSIFGAFIFGLTIPKDGNFAGKLIRRIEDFVTGLLLPLYFASSGLKTDIAKIKNLEAWGLLVLVISTACAGKVISTFLVAMFCMIPVRESLVLGVLMNTKGLVELIVLNIGKDKKVLDDEMFAILVLMALFTTFMTTPIAMAIYKPVRDISDRIHQGTTSMQESRATEKSQEKKLRILACSGNPAESPSLINLIESIRSSNDHSATKLYIMQLVELTDRSSSIMLVQRARKNGFPCIGRFQKGGLNDNQVGAAFEANSQLGKVIVRPTMSISSLSFMHEDICHVAETKKAGMIILPFHKQWRNKSSRDDGTGEINLGEGWKGVNERVLASAPCSVGVFIDRGFEVNGGKNTPADEAPFLNQACLIFLGGPDSRKVLEIGSRMALHPAVRVTIIRLTMLMSAGEGSSSFQMYAEREDIEANNSQKEKETDESALFEFKKKFSSSTDYIEKEANNIVQQVVALGQSEKYDLIVIGRGRFPSDVAAKLDHFLTEEAQLGPVGDLLASSGQGIKCSVLVIQSHEPEKNHTR